MDDRDYLLSQLNSLYLLHKNCREALRAEPNSKILQDLLLKYEREIAEIEGKLQL